MKTILITGANGFIGSHTLSFLTEQPDIRLIAACRDKRKLPVDFKGEVREGDLRDSTYLESLLDEVDVVIHAMSWTSLWGNEQTSEALFLKPSLDLIEQFHISKATSFVNISTLAAASPKHSSNPLSNGIPRKFWPHLNNVIKLENTLRKHAHTDKKVVNMRLGIFAGERYALGIIPILLPRLKTHLVPWVNGGRTHMAITDGRDLSQAVGLAALNDDLPAYEAFNIAGKDIPTVREIILFLHEEFGYPKPHFSVPFTIAYPFAWLMEKLDIIVPWEPLIVRSIVHLLEETNSNNDKAIKILSYQPKHDWKDAIRLQIAEMEKLQTKAMSMAKPVT